MLPLILELLRTLISPEPSKTKLPETSRAPALRELTRLMVPSVPSLSRSAEIPNSPPNCDPITSSLSIKISPSAKKPIDSSETSLAVSVSFRSPSEEKSMISRVRLVPIDPLIVRSLMEAMRKFPVFSERASTEPEKAPEAPKIISPNSSTVTSWSNSKRLVLAILSVPLPK